MVLRRNPTPPKPKPFKLKPLSYFIGEDGVAFSVDWTKMKVVDDDTNTSMKIPPEMFIKIFSIKVST